MALQLRDSSSLSSVPSSTCSYTYDVFLSFRGEDTRHGFTGHLYKSLLEKGINTFIDDELTRGKEISQALLRAIDESKFSLIVFSENYASSKWCLDELVHIIECKSSKNQQVRPIFYKVEPSDVRHQRGTFGLAIAELERLGMANVFRWREALTEAANLAGWHVSGGYEYEFIEKIAQEVSANVKEPIHLDMPEYKVGLDSRVEHMLEMLDVGGSDVRMVGIWGSGGIGKTTIAKGVYNAIARKFDGSCFLPDVRKGSEKHGGLVDLQNCILSSILGQKESKINNIHTGLTLLRKSLKHRRILLVVDDVDSSEQLKKLVGRTDWYGRGSRVIITTRDEHLLTSHQVNQIYKAPELNRHEARVLFCANGIVDYEDLEENEKLIVTSVVEYAHGIPLALEVFGSDLCDTPINEWRAILHGFKRDPPKRIQDILTISYDGLQESVKKVFLDIACFFNGWKRNNVIQILEGCDRINPKYSIQVLEQKALIYDDRDGNIRMHDLVEEMGKVKVSQESTEPGERSRLWHYKDVLDVLTENRGTRKIEGIMVKMPTADKILLSRKCFKKMENLKIFINVNGRFVGKVDHYPNQLRVLDWPDCPLQSLPSNFDTKKLIHFNMSDSRISRLGKAFKSMQNLTSLNFKSCEFLTQIPDLSGSPNLEYLNLSWCPNLLEIHPSVGSLEKLVELNLMFCWKLVKLPEKVKWRSLRKLDLENCMSLESFPEIVGEMKHITSLELRWTGIKALPSSIRNLINLEKLHLSGYVSLTLDLPCSIYELQKLTTVTLNGYTKHVTFPNKVDSEVVPTYSNASHDDLHSLSGSTSMDNSVLPWLRTFDASGSNLSNIDFLASLGWASRLSELTLSYTPIAVLPEWIKEFVNLWKLDLSDCRSLVEIPELPSRIEWLDVRYCVSLERISKLSNILERKESQMIEWMNLSNCWRLCQNLVQQIANEEDDEVVADILFCRLLSSQQFKFTVRFPVQRSEVPNWFSCQMDFMGHDGGFEFWIETLPNFKWDNNNTGLALCVTIDMQDPGSYCSFGVFIYINEVHVLGLPYNYVYSENVWVHYVPFHEMWRFGYMRPLSPFMCRVIIQNYHDMSSCGVHLVMPPNEDVCMQLIRVVNLTSELRREGIKKGNWETYRRPKERTDCKQLCTDDAQQEN